MNILLAVIFIITPILSLKVYNKYFFSDNNQMKWTVLAVIAFAIELLFAIVLGNYFIAIWGGYSVFVIGPFLLIAVGSAIIDQKKSS